MADIDQPETDAEKIEERPKLSDMISTTVRGEAGMEQPIPTPQSDLPSISTALGVAGQAAGVGFENDLQRREREAYQLAHPEEMAIQMVAGGVLGPAKNLAREIAPDVFRLGEGGVNLRGVEPVRPMPPSTAPSAEIAPNVFNVGKGKVQIGGPKKMAEGGDVSAPIATPAPEPTPADQNAMELTGAAAPPIQEAVQRVAQEAPKVKTIPLYDISTQNPVLGDMPETDVQEAVSSGEFSFPKDYKVPVISPDGERGFIPAEQAAEHFQNGYKFETTQEVKQAEYGTPGQQAITALEGAAEGLVGPLAPAAERLLGVSPEAIRAREEVNPITHGAAEATAFVGSMLLGTGEAKVLAKAGEFAGKALAIGGKTPGALAKIGNAGLRGAVEMGIYQAGDELSKMIKEDPHQSAQTALSSIGISTLLGAAGGGAFESISPLWKTVAGNKIAREMEHFSNRVKYIEESGGDPLGALAKEVEEHHTAIEGIHSGTWGETGLRAEATTKGLAELNDGMVKDAMTIENQLAAARKDLVEYGATATQLSKFDRMANKFTAVSQRGDASASALFNSLQEAKDEIWGMTKFQGPPRHATDISRIFDETVKPIGSAIRELTANPKVWGDAGKNVALLNSTVSKLIEPAKWFAKNFMTKDLATGGLQVDMGKLAKHLSAMERGVGKGEVTSKNLLDYLNAVEKHVDSVNAVRSSLGLSGDLSVPTTLMRGATQELPLGAKLADDLVKHGAEKLLGDISGTAAGAAVGSIFGAHGGWIGGILGKYAVSPVLQRIMPIAIEGWKKSPRAMGALAAAGRFVGAVAKGDQILSQSAKDILKGTAMVLPKNVMPTEKDRELLKGAINDKDTTATKLMQGGSQLQTFMPDHASAISNAAGGIMSYIEGQQPLEDKARPFDTRPVISQAHKAAFDRTLDIAAQPMIVMQHIADGTLTSKDVKDLGNMYPQLYAGMVQKLTNEAIAHTAEGKTIPYKTRISLSLFCAEPLDSTMTPATIQATQAAHLSASIQQAMRQGASSSTKSLGKGTLKMQMTPEQTAESRRSTA